MPNLYPDGYEDEIITESDTELDQKIGYRNGVSFDYDTGDFQRDGRNRIVDSDGIESWREWCINCISTERYKHLAYSTNYGIEIEKAMASTTREEAESILTRQITEAILADPYGRAIYIEEIVFSWTSPDAIETTVTIRGTDDVTIDITAYITRGN